jgi:hypothetical protein
MAAGHRPGLAQHIHRHDDRRLSGTARDGDRQRHPDALPAPISTRGPVGGGSFAR